MKKFYAGWVALGMLCFGFTLAGADTIIDAYWGGTVHNASATAYGDVIGNPYFSVESMTVTRSGNNWTVAIVGPYFGNYLDPSVDFGLPSKLGPGDLYLNSAGWVATLGTGHYETDTFSNSEGWNYVVTNVNGSWGLYRLDYSKINYTTVSPQLNPNNYIFRYDQAWEGGAGTLPADFIGAATYNLTSTGLIIAFNTGNEVFADDVGFHWTMQCGNDVIEGNAHVPVPEPGTMLLLGTGLIGLAGYSRKRFCK